MSGSNQAHGGWGDDAQRWRCPGGASGAVTCGSAWAGREPVLEHVFSRLRSDTPLGAAVTARHALSAMGGQLHAPFTQQQSVRAPASCMHVLAGGDRTSKCVTELGSHRRLLAVHMGMSATIFSMSAQLHERSSSEHAAQAVLRSFDASASGVQAMIEAVPRWM
jgi:hypothetical protein